VHKGVTHSREPVEVSRAKPSKESAARSHGHVTSPTPALTMNTKQLGFPTSPQEFRVQCVRHSTLIAWQGRNHLFVKVKSNKFSVLRGSLFKKNKLRGDNE
jgi:hypothetical protein